MAAKPTKKQLEWQDMELGVIIHLCADIFDPDFHDIKTSGVRERLSPDKMDSCAPDTDQWLRCASELGAKYAVLVANHCTGFSLWPTKENDYSVASMKWKNGKGDVVADFIEACKKYNIKPALYYSTGCNGYYCITDEVKHDYKAAYYREYSAVVERQLTELWNNYGELFEIWFDGGVVPFSKGGPDVEGLLRKYQPDAITFQGPAGYENNIRWVGNEAGVAPEDCFCSFDAADGSPDGRGSITGRYYCPAESDFPNRTAKGFGGGWAWRDGEEDTVIPPEKLFECYLNTVGRNTNMLLGMGISTDGDFKDEEQFIRLGEIIRREFSDEIPLSIKIDGNTFTVFPESTKPIKYLVIREKLDDGQHINGFTLSADGRKMAEGSSIGHKRILCLNGLKAENLTLKITDSYGEYSLRDIKAYS